MVNLAGRAAWVEGKVQFRENGKYGELLIVPAEKFWQIFLPIHHSSFKISSCSSGYKYWRNTTALYSTHANAIVQVLPYAFLMPLLQAT